MLRAGRFLLLKGSNTYGVGFFIYFGVALISALNEWGFFITALRFTTPLPAAIIGFIVATGVNFFLSRRYVFHSKRSLFSEFALVYTVSGIAFMANISLFFTLYRFSNVNLILAKIMGTGFAFAFNYGIRQFFVYSAASRFATVTAFVNRRRLPNHLLGYRARKTSRSGLNGQTSEAVSNPDQLAL